ncbi:MAG TPA: type III secretion system export apparatus subunit SctT [Ramlibacter sp.]|uniref:type III secretion system export apparatus subunit SctT n=1 Tax=Ramlibacter sp. TaxID=1917967 RepID=UPI002B5E05F4|nr:type III secretion system export apparatus subunit SctT [Ramlibacter sp.]HVZ45035.1 type III secretion system export apparatus subunit SctT [Ramlibacter sp.]
MDLINVIFAHLKALGFAMPRFLGVFAILPLLTRETLPMMLRMGVVGSLALFLVPSLVDEAMKPHEMIEVLAVLCKEVFLGMALGVVLAIPLWSLEAMGDLCDVQRGASIAQTLNPLLGEESSPLGQLFSTAGVTFLFAIGAFLLLLGVIYDSFEIWPVFGWWPKVTPEATRLVLELLDRFMRLAVLLAAPVIFSMFLAEAGMAIASRFVPQLQVFFLAMPVKSGIAMLVFAIYGVILFDYTRDLVTDTIRDANRTVFAMFRGARAP